MFQNNVDKVTDELCWPVLQMYPSIQAKIWGNIGQIADLLDMVLDSFIKVTRPLQSWKLYLGRSGG